MNIKIFFLAMLITSPLFVCCINIDFASVENVDSDKIACRLSIGMAQTKTTISVDGDDAIFSWKRGDKIGVMIDEIQNNVPFTCTDPSSGDFEGYVLRKKISKESNVYAFSPFFKEEKMSSYSVVEFKLPETQTSPYDPSADFIIATPESFLYDEEHLIIPDLLFNTHTFAIVKLAVKNTDPNIADEKLQSIGLKSLSQTKPLCGVFNIDLKNLTAEITENEGYVVSSSFTNISLGLNVVHTVYLVVNPNSFDVGELKLVVKTKNHSILLETTSSVELQSNEVSNFPLVTICQSSDIRNRNVILWGDSITAQMFDYYMREQLGSSWTVYGSGIGADQPYQIAARQGALPCYTGQSSFTLSHDSSIQTPVEGLFAYDDLYDGNKYRSVYNKYTQNLVKNSLVNPITLSFVLEGKQYDILCNIYADQENQCYINRLEDGDEDIIIPARTRVYTAGARDYRNPRIQVIYMGSNGRPNDEYLKNMYKKMMDFCPNSITVVLGFHHSVYEYGDRYWTTQYSNTMRTAFPDNYVDLRVDGNEDVIALMKEIGDIEDESELSTIDLEYIGRGDWPFSWGQGYGNVHLSHSGTKAMTILSRRKMQELGVLDE